jgi:hypothetical protein
MSTQKKILSIAELRKRTAGEMEFEDGERHDVLQMDFETHQRLSAVDDSPDSFAVLRDVVRKVVPSLRDEQIMGLTPEIAQAILTMSGAGIAAVERLFPNAVRPEGQTSPA